jgi:type IV pilus assembly protein PilQ
MPRREDRTNRTPAELVRFAGRLPATAVISLGLAGSGLAQEGSPGVGGPGGVPAASGGVLASAPAEPPMTPRAKPTNPVSDQPPARVQHEKPGPASLPGSGDQPQVAVSEHMTVDLHVKDEDLSSVLEMLAMQSQKNIITSKGVTGRVTASLYGVTFNEALDNILHPNGFGYIEQGNFIHVYTIEELVKIQESLKKRVAKVIYLNYINADDAKNLVEPLRSEHGEIRIPKKTDAFTIPETAPTGKDDYALASSIVVIDYEDNVSAIEKLVAELDTRPAQVLVEATVLQVSLTEANAFGVDFSIIGDLKFTDFINTGGARSAADSIIGGGQGATGNGLSPADNQGTALSSTPGNTLTGPASFKLGVISDDISIFLRALDEVTDTTIISNPKVLALNRQPSRVLVGRRVGYLKTTSSETSTVTEPDFLDTGTQLHFRPFIAKDGSIRMELKPQISEAIIRDAASAGGQVQTIPDLVTQEIVTNVIVRDGQSIVLGGLFRESTTLTRRQVPMLGDIPVVGAAFRGNDDTTQRSEIVFVITPSIVTDAAASDQANKVFDDAERVRAGNRQGLLMWSREKMTAALNVEAEQLARDGEHEKAMWKLNRSLALNPGQPEAYRLRERITGEKEVWPSRSMLDNIVGKEVSERLQEVPPSPTPIKMDAPYGSHDLPKRKVEPRKYHLSDGNPADGNGAGAAGADGDAPGADPSDPTRPDTGPSNGHPQAGANGPTTVPSAMSTASMEARQLNLTATLTPSYVQEAQAGGRPDGAAHGAKPAEDPRTAATVSHTTTLLSTLRNQIELFSVKNHGELPALGAGEAFGWQPLIDQRYLRTPPVNPWLTGPNASRVVIGRGPDSDSHEDYGWIYNPQTGQLWAAATDDDGRALAHTDVPPEAPPAGEPAVTQGAPTRSPGGTPAGMEAAGPRQVLRGEPVDAFAGTFAPDADDPAVRVPAMVAPDAPRSRGFFGSLTRNIFAAFTRTGPVQPETARGSQTADAPTEDDQRH